MNKTCNSFCCVLSWVSLGRPCIRSRKPIAIQTSSGLLLEDGSSVSSLKASSFFASCFLQGPVWVVRLFSEVHWVEYRSNSLLQLHFFIFFDSLRASFVYKLFIWATLTPHILAIILFSLKHKNNRIKVHHIIPHILNSK